MNSQRTKHILLYAWLAFILIISIIPGRHFPKAQLAELDKFAHIFLYLVLLYLMLLAHIGEYNPKFPKLKIILLIMIGSVYGVMIEIMQGMIFATRTFEITDMIANSIGCLLGLLLFLSLNKLKL